MKHCIFLNGEKSGVIQKSPEFIERFYFSVPPARIMAVSINSPLFPESVPLRQIEYKMTFASLDRECGLYTTNGDWREILYGGDWVATQAERVHGKKQDIIFEEPISFPRRVSLKQQLKRALLECREGRTHGAEYFINEILDDLEEVKP